MLNKSYLLFTILLLVLPIIQGATEENFVTYEVNSEIDLELPCDAGGGRGCNTDFTCNYSITYPNKTGLVENQSLSFIRDGFFNYSIESQSTEGIYLCGYYCYNSSNTYTSFSECSIRVTDELLWTKISKLPARIWSAIVGKGLSANQTLTNINLNQTAEDIVVESSGGVTWNQERAIKQERKLSNTSGITNFILKTWFWLVDFAIGIYQNTIVFWILVAGLLLGAYNQLHHKITKIGGGVKWIKQKPFSS